MNKVGIVTVTYNSSDVIQGFLNSVFVQTYENFLLYIVDNSSEDETLVKVFKQNDPRIKIIANKDNKGVAAGNNQGIQASIKDGCNLILLINNDVEFESDVLQKLITEIQSGVSDIVVPKITHFDEPQKIWFAGGRFLENITYFAVHIGWGEIDSDKHNIAKNIEYAPTCCMLIKKEVFDKVGLMDEKYFVYQDDVDFCLRAKKKNILMSYTGCTKILHKVSSLTGGIESDFATYYGTRNRVYFIKKNIGGIIFLSWLIQKQIRIILTFIFSGKHTVNKILVTQKGFLNGITL
jgi:GT2 family glycosyltransferase